MANASSSGEQKSWIAYLLDEHEEIIPASALSIIGVASFIAVFWLLTTIQGRDVLARFIPVTEHVDPVAQDAQNKKALLAATATGKNNTLSDDEKRELLKSLAERIDSGEEQILSDDDKRAILASFKNTQ